MHSAGEGNRWLGGLLVAIGLLGLFASVYISWRFGWSLADDAVDRTVTATIHSLADVAAAGLILAGASMWVWRWWFRSILALTVALTFTAYGFLSAFGFFSHRIVVATAQQVAAKQDEKFLGWLQNQTVNTEIARSERKTMFAEAKAANEGLKRTLSEVKDKQATAVAGLFGWSPEVAQRRLVAATAAIAYGVKYSGLWFGGMMWARLRRKKAIADTVSSSPTISSSPKGGSGNDEGSGGKAKSESETVKQDATVIPLRAEPPRLQAAVSPPVKVRSGPPRVPAPAPSPSLKLSHLTIPEIVAAYPASSQRALAAMSGKSEATVSRELKRLEGRGKVKRTRKGRAKQITRVPNGGIHVFG